MPTNWEYKDFVLEWNTTGPVYRLGTNALLVTARTDLWTDLKPDVMRHLQDWLNAGWEPMTTIGPDCVVLETREQRELGGGGALLGVNTYVYLKEVRIQMRRPSQIPEKKPNDLPVSERRIPSVASRQKVDFSDLPKDVQIQVLLLTSIAPTRGHVNQEHVTKAVEIYSTLKKNGNPLAYSLSMYNDAQSVYEAYFIRWMDAMKLNPPNQELLRQDLVEFAFGDLGSVLAHTQLVDSEVQTQVLKYAGIKFWLEETLLSFLLCFLRILEVPVSDYQRKALVVSYGDDFVKLVEDEAEYLYKNHPKIL